jgi:hypothetical protein
MSPESPIEKAITPAVKKPRGVRTNITLINKTIPVYAGKKVSEALTELTDKMTIYHGVKLSQILDAVYAQGMKDGARGVFDQVDGLKRAIPHRNPGHPRKQKK